jgi:hypothetical protein
MALTFAEGFSGRPTAAPGANVQDIKVRGFPNPTNPERFDQLLAEKFSRSSD